MTRTLLCASALAAVCVVPMVHAQDPDARQVAQERAQAERDLPHLVEALELQPGMTVADVGSGGGAVTVVLGKWNSSGRVFATDITERGLRLTRDYAKREGLNNVTVLEGAAGATNLPDACCDAIVMRDVYHHITEVESFNKSLRASLKPGGRLAIIDFRPDKGSKLPAGVPANREGHGVPPAVVMTELTAAGFTHLKTVDRWPPGDKNPLFLVLFRKS
jgi:ubiquinone/menaquinone biosynthesis C-methylase UbiE